MKRFVGILLLVAMLTASFGAFADLKNPELGGEDLNKYTTAPKLLGFSTKDHPVPKLIQAKPVDAVFPVNVWAYLRARLFAVYQGYPPAREDYPTFEAYYADSVEHIMMLYTESTFFPTNNVPPSWIGRHPRDVMTLEEYIVWSIDPT